MAEIEKSLGKLAEEINAEHRAFVGTFRKTVEHGIRAGELLATAKEQCPHGTWLPWLEENFEGAPRTAQEYMRLYNHRDEIRAKTRDSAHLSVSGALKELAATKAGPGDASEGRTDIIRELMDYLGPEVSGPERDILEHRLADPGPAEEELLGALVVEDLYLLAVQVEVDGFLFERGDGDKPLITYRTPEKTKIVKVSIPATGEEHAEYIHRGCWQYALADFRVWRLLSNWWTKTLAADATDLDAIEERIVFNADWRKAEVAADYLRDRVFGRDPGERQWGFMRCSAGSRCGLTCARGGWNRH